MSLFPWSEWRSGMIVTVREGVDFSCSAATLRDRLYQHAARHSLKVRTSVDGATHAVTFQFWDPTGAEPPAWSASQVSLSSRPPVRRLGPGLPSITVEGHLLTDDFDETPCPECEAAYAAEDAGLIKAFAREEVTDRHVKLEEARATDDASPVSFGPRPSLPPSSRPSWGEVDLGGRGVVPTPVPELDAYEEPCDCQKATEAWQGGRMTEADRDAAVLACSCS